MNIATTPDDPNAVYVVYRSSSGHCTLERSTDNGQNWMPLVNDGILYTDFYIVPQLAISPLNSDHIYIGSLRPYRYDPINSEFDKIGSNLHDDTRDFHIVNSGGDEILYTGNDAGVAVSYDNGTTWTKMHEGLQGALFYNIAISDIDTDLFLGGTGDCGTHRYNRVNWKNMNTYYGDGGNTLIDNNDPDTMYAMVNRRYYYSHDGGEHWTATSTSHSAQEYDPPIIQHPTKDRIYIVVQDQGSGIRYTNDAGRNWINYFPPSWDARIIAMAISASDPDIFYFARVAYTLVGDHYEISGDIKKTTDNGNNWTTVSSGLGSIMDEARVTDIEIHPTNPDIVWVCFGGLSDGKKVYQSENGGSSWSNITHDLDNFPVIDLEYDHGNHQLYIGTDIGVFTKEFDSNLWSRMGDFPHAIASGVEINHTSGKLVASTWGRGLWETEIPGHCYNGNWIYVDHSETWTTDRDLCENLMVVYGGGLTITSTVTMPYKASIVVVQNGSLTIDGGTIKNADIEVQSYGSLTIKNNGVIELNNEDDLLIENGAYFTNLLGEIKIIPED